MAPHHFLPRKQKQSNVAFRCLINQQLNINLNFEFFKYG